MKIKLILEGALHGKSFEEKVSMVEAMIKKYDLRHLIKLPPVDRNIFIHSFSKWLVKNRVSNTKDAFEAINNLCDITISDMVEHGGDSQTLQNSIKFWNSKREGLLYWLRYGNIDNNINLQGDEIEDQLGYIRNNFFTIFYHIQNVIDWMIKESEWSPAEKRDENKKLMLPDSRGNVEAVKAVKHFLGIFRGVQSELYGWLYPDGTTSDISDFEVDGYAIHGNVMTIIDNEYSNRKNIENDGPVDFALLTGSIRVHGSYIEIFTQITPEQLGWIRRHFRGKPITIFCANPGGSESLEIPELSWHDWNIKFNEYLIKTGAVSFDILKEGKMKIKLILNEVRTGQNAIELVKDGLKRFANY